MQEFVSNYCEQITKDINFTVKEKRIYRFEEIGPNLEYSSKNMNELASFYYLCGFRTFEHCIKYGPIFFKFAHIRHHTQSFALPVHNAVAFFQELKKLQQSLPHKEMCSVLTQLLPYALPCYGFVFGTSFYAEELYCIHPCDLKYTTPQNFVGDEIYKMREEVLRSQAELQVGRDFLLEKCSLNNTIHNLVRQKSIVEQWVQESNANSGKKLEKYLPPWRMDIATTKAMFEDFIDLYCEYSLKQLGNQNTYPEKVKSGLNEIKSIAQIFFVLEGLYRELENVITVGDEVTNINCKCRWLENVHTELERPGMQENYKIMKGSKIGPKNQEDIPELYDLIFRKIREGKTQYTRSELSE